MLWAKRHSRGYFFCDPALTLALLTTSVVVSILLGCLAGCGTAKNKDRLASSDRGPDQTAAEDELRVLAPVTHANLTVFPVVSSNLKSADRFLTLDEGLASGKVEVFEVGGQQPANPEAQSPAGANDETPPPPTGNAPPDVPAQESPAASSNDEVPPAPPTTPFEDATDDEFAEDPFAAQAGQSAQAAQGPAQQIRGDENGQGNQVLQELGDFGATVERVIVVNHSDKPLYLMPGEIILGGQQDRCVAKETIVAATGEPVEVEVFCVEHGRWSGRSSEEYAAALPAASVGEFQSNLSLIVSGQDVEALDNKFVASAGALNIKGRMAVQALKDQSEVWKAVEEVNAKTGNASQTNAFTANYASPEISADLQPFLEALDKPVLQHERVVGVIVAINGKVEAADIFESTPLFRKIWPKLLQSYALEAASSADNESAPSVATREHAEKFLAELQQAQVQETESSGGLTLTSRESGSARFFSAADASDIAGGMGGGLGGAVHTSGFAR